MQELKIYNKFEDLILHLEYKPERAELRIIEAPPQLRRAILSLVERDLDEMILASRKPMRFSAAWGSSGYIEVLAAFIAANYGWKTKILYQGEDARKNLDLHGAANLSEFVPSPAHRNEPSTMPLSSWTAILRVNELPLPEDTENPSLNPLQADSVNARTTVELHAA